MAAVSGPAEVDLNVLIEIFRKAVLINKNEDKFRAIFMGGQHRFVLYPVRGQEVVAAGMMSALRLDDYLVCTYRGIHDQLAKGVEPRHLWAEFLGRSTGTCRGKGGPMHITDPDKGVMVSTGIVGSGLPIATGLALSSQMAGDGRVTVVSFGDGASNIGAFHEALNLASLWNLPVIFLCQNNRMAEHTTYADGTSAARIVDRAIGYSMAEEQVDGNDAEAMYGAARRAVDRARSGQGPTLLEAMTYRMAGHTQGSGTSGMDKAFLALGKASDPMPRLRQRLEERGVAQATLLAIEDEAVERAEDAFRFAEASPFPDLGEIRLDVLETEIPW